MTRTADGPARPAVPLPGTHFYILSKAQAMRRGVLAMATASDRVIVAAYQPGDDRQLWMRRALPDGSYALINKAAKLCIGAYPPQNGTPLLLYPLNQIDTARSRIGATTRFRAITTRSTRPSIGSRRSTYPRTVPIPRAGLVTWQWSRGAPNELWAQVSADKFGYKLVSLAFDTAKARIDPLAPIAGNDKGATNNGPVQANLTIATTQRLTTTTAFSPRQGLPTSRSRITAPGRPWT
ncbi:MAG: hypothetical protein WDM81_00810 [Rhizomicrobium sp.]